MKLIYSFYISQFPELCRFRKIRGEISEISNISPDSLSGPKFLGAQMPDKYVERLIEIQYKTSTHIHGQERAIVWRGRRDAIVRIS